MGLKMIEVTATNLPRLIACNGSRLLSTLASVQQDNTVRDEGIAAHRLIVDHFNDPLTPIKKTGLITDDMIEHVEKYVSELKLAELFEKTVVSLEHDVSIFSDNFTISSITDCIIDEGDAIEIKDFKYGWRIVEPENNLILMIYAIGYCLKYNKTPSTIKLTIHQPRPFHTDGPVRTWAISYNDLSLKFAEIADTLNKIGRDLNTGSHCAKCRALSSCPAARKAALNSIDVSCEAFNDSLTNEQVANELDALTKAKFALDNRISALEELAEFRISKGETIRNYYIERKRANNTWKTGINYNLMKTLTGIDLRSSKMITPNQAVKAGVDKAVVDNLTHRPTTGSKIKRLDADKQAKKVFK